MNEENAMTQTHVKELMTENPVIIGPNATLKEAAQKMEEINCGALPVGTADKVEGMITDRDIVIRAVAKGKDVNVEKVKAYMTPKVHSIKEYDTPDHAAEMMREQQVNRILVEDKNGKPCGIITFGRMLRENDSMQEVTTIIECAIGKKAA
jgi:CBS domain-containing protein